jgi:thiol-disulfide isomerase/thioredoxin
MRAVLLRFLVALCLSGAAPPATIEGTTLDGVPFSVAALKSRVVLINFWATWCAPCRTEMPALDGYYLAHRADGLVMIAISMDDPARRKAARQFAGGFHFPTAIVRDVTLPSALRPAMLPVTLVYDRNGALRYDSRRAKDGPMDAATLDRVVGPILREGAGR